VNTVISDPPRTVDLLSRPESAQAWWAQRAAVLPTGQAPAFEASGSLRAAARAIFDALIDGEPWPEAAVSTVNTFAAAAPASEAIRVLPGGASAERRWHTESQGQAMLAAIAEDAIRLLADEPRRSRLRRCANPSCSIIFLAKHPRRVWCSGSTCGNRRRVARHYRSTRAATTKEQS
jgi:predicted RNA-binding Zn ribbon-like protein